MIKELILYYESFMDDYLFAYITWGDLKTLAWLDLDKTFEYLCADFLQIYLWLTVPPLVSQNDTFPWIEWDTFEYKWKVCWFQSKLWKDAFENSNTKGFWKSFITIDSSIKKWTYKLEKLFLFSIIDFPVTSLAKKEGFNEKTFKLSNDHSIESKLFHWENFLNELKKKKYWDIINKYFSIKEVKVETWRKIQVNEKPCPSALDAELRNVDNFFLGNSKLYDIDRKKAKEIQRKYSINKLSFINYPWIIEVFDKIEKHIYNETSYLIKYGNYNSLKDFESDFLKEINELSPFEFDTELNKLLHKRWLVVNYWTQGYYNLLYRDKGDINEGEWIVQFNNLKNE